MPRVFPPTPPATLPGSVTAGGHFGKRLPAAAWVGLAVVLASLAAPPLFWSGRGLVAAGWAPALAPFSFPTYLRRAWLVAALACTPLWLGGACASRARVAVLAGRGGHRRRRAFFRSVAVGLTLGAAGMAPLLAGLLWAGWLRPSGAATFWPWVLLSATLSAALVATVEEVTFRGLLLTRLSRRFGPWPGAVASVLCFAAVHFVAVPTRGPVVEQIRWYAGLEGLLHLLAPLLAPRAHGLAFVSLLAVGSTLTLAARRGRSVGLALGLHAAWVFGLRVVAQSCVRLRPADAWLDRELRHGWLVCGLALATAALLWALPEAWLAGGGGDNDNSEGKPAE